MSQDVEVDGSVIFVGEAWHSTSAHVLWRLLQNQVSIRGCFFRTSQSLDKDSPVFFRTSSLWGRLSAYRHWLFRKKCKSYENPVYLSGEELSLQYPLRQLKGDDLVKNAEGAIGVFCAGDWDPDYENLPVKKWLRLRFQSTFEANDADFPMLVEEKQPHQPWVPLSAFSVVRSELDHKNSLYLKALWLGSKKLCDAVQGDVCEELEKEDVSLEEAEAMDSEIAESQESRKKVLHVITRMTRGGAQQNTAATLQLNRYHNVLLTGMSWGLEGEIFTEALENGREVVIVPELIRALYPLKDFVAFWRIRSVIKKGRFDIVHTHMSKGGLLGRLACLGLRVPILIHTPHGHVFHSYFSKWKEQLFLTLEKWASNWATRLVALTKRECVEHLELGVGKAEQWVEIPSGVSKKRFESIDVQRKRALREQLQIPPSAMIVGFLGRLAEIKGPEDFIRATEVIEARIKDVVFLVVGDGPQREACKALAKSLPCHEKIIFTGDQKDSALYMSLMDVFVVPSLNEGMGRVIVEAGFLKKPVVATRVGGILDLIDGKHTGLLVEPRDPEAIAEAVCKILEDTLLALRLGERLYERVVPAFTEEAMTQKIDDLYRECLEQLC